MKNKILAIMLATGMMTGMVSAPAAVSAADVSPLEQLVNEMNNQILPNPNEETTETTETDDGSSVLADAGSANDEIDPSFSQYDSILAPSSIINEWIQQQNTANTEEAVEPAETTPAEDEYLAGEEFEAKQDTQSVWYGSFAGTPVTVTLSDDGVYTITMTGDMYTRSYSGNYALTTNGVSFATTSEPLIMTYSEGGEILAAFRDGEEYRLVKSHSDEAPEEAIDPQEFFGAWKTTSISEHGEEVSFDAVSDIEELYVQAYNGYATLHIKMADGTVIEFSELQLKVVDGKLCFNISEPLVGNVTCVINPNADDAGIMMKVSFDDRVVDLDMEYCMAN